MSGAEQLRSGYHNILRPELLSLIPESATSILDLGCGTGELGKALKKRQSCVVDGIELSKDASEAARQHLNTVYKDNLNRFDTSFLKRKYDALVLGDILEHLIAPWFVLKNFAQVLTDNGVVVASVPNIAHPWVISQLQKGLFRYELAGLLDVTHLRFFTKTTIGQLFFQAGLKIQSIEPHPSAANPIQYLVKAVKPVLEHKKPLATILILTYNAWKYTAQCLGSIKAYTDIPYKILVIDNGSSDDTISHLRDDTSIFHIENSSNLGFARGFNVGLERIDTPYFVLCNSDVVVTRHWLKRLIEHLTDDKDLIGIGPRTNCVSGPQLVQNCAYNTESELDDFALRFSRSCKAPTTPFHRLVFFLTAFKSDVLPLVGLLDERYEGGNYEDDDYCMRILTAKKKLAIDNSVFVHHYGSQTFKYNKIDYAKTMTENRKKFMAKWHLTEAPRQKEFGF